MSQQAMFPESQGEHSQDNEEYKPYYWSTTPVAGKGKTGDVLKNEHPATFEDTIPPYSYAAQEQAPPRQEPRYGENADKAKSEYQRTQQTRQQQFNVGGQTFEQGSRPSMQQPYSMAQQVPSWAHPQRNNRGSWRVTALIILGFIFLKPLLFVAIHLLAGVGILFGIAALAIIVPIIFALMLAGFAIVVLLVILSALGVPIRRRRRRFWGGPWGY